MFKIPTTLTTGTLHLIIQELSALENQSFIIDWKNCNHITNEAHCGILHLKEIIKAKKITLIHDYETHRHRTYATFEKVWNCSVDKDCALTSDGVYISPILLEAKLSSDISKIIRFIKEKYKHSSQKDFSPLESILSELYMNICQHSGTEKGFIFITAPDNKNNIFIYVSDIGNGIASKIKSHFVSIIFENDADAIEYATKGGITTQSIRANRGLGLETLKMALSSLGDFKIISGKGLFFSNASQLSKEKISYKHIGTLINIQISLDRLDEIDYEDDNNSLDF